MHWDFEVALRRVLKPNIVYKLRHKPTGLFFIHYETRHKRNLSASGKVYTHRPSLSYVAYGYRDEQSKFVKYTTKSQVSDEWEIVQYELKEILNQEKPSGSRRNKVLDARE